MPAAEAFLAVSGQWRLLAPFGGKPVFLGLDATAAETNLRLSGVEITPLLWRQLRLIEEGAKAALNGG